MTRCSLPTHGSRLRTLARGLLAPVLLCATAATAHTQVRIAEVLVNPLGADAGHQVVEIANFGGSIVSISGWRLASATGLAVLPSGRTLLPGAHYLIHLSADGTNDAMHYYTGSGFAPISASSHALSLYGPSGSIGDPAALRDFVQWGAGGQAGEGTASSADLWMAGQYVPITSEGNSMQLCATSVTGPSAWIEAAPTLGNPNNCSSQTQESTWGRLKSFYR